MGDNDWAVDRSPGGRVEEVSQTYDWTAIKPSTAVVETVAAATDTEPTALEVLQTVIDADALDALVRSADRDDKLRVSFEYAGTGVRVQGNGTVVVTVD